MNTHKYHPMMREKDMPRKSTLQALKEAGFAIVVVALILMGLTLYSSNVRASEHLLHPGDISGHSAPVTVVCRDPGALMSILIQPTMELVAEVGLDMARSGRCIALPAPAVVQLNKAMGFVIVPPGVTSGMPVRATIYRVERKDGDTENEVQYFVYALEPLRES